MKEPNLPEEYKKNRRILSDEQLEKAKQMLLDGHSERYIAKHFNVSRHAVMIYIKPSRMENYVRLKKEWDANNKEQVRKTNNRLARERYALKNKLFPKEMKKAREISKEKVGKEYFREYMSKYRKEGDI